MRSPSVRAGSDLFRTGYADCRAVAPSGGALFREQSRTQNTRNILDELPQVAV
jgi:hypothetical protein